MYSLTIFKTKFQHLILFFYALIKEKRCNLSGIFSQGVAVLEHNSKEELPLKPYNLYSRRLQAISN
jgi:hypothetical protein